jgi:DNA-binding NarL/FixJ family response regulator
MIFIVDDSKVIRERLVNMLSEIDGIEVCGQAQSAVEAIAGIRSLRPRVVILDIGMPGGSGIEVLRTIKKDLNPPIVLMLTNHPYKQYRDKCMELGADYFLDKTQDFENMTEIVTSLVTRFEYEREEQEHKTI